MRLSLYAAAIAPLLLLPSCVGAPEQPSAPSPARAPTPRPAPPPPPAPVEWRYRPATPGNWSYAADDAGSVAAFAAPGGGMQLTIRCDNATRLVGVTRAGAGQGPLIVRTSYGAASWPSVVSTSGMAATRAASDPVLDQIAYSRGRFAIEVAGLDMLILPSWGEVGRVIEDCRR